MTDDDRREALLTLLLNPWWEIDRGYGGPELVLAMLKVEGCVEYFDGRGGAHPHVTLRHCRPTQKGLDFLTQQNDDERK